MPSSSTDAEVYSVQGFQLCGPKIVSYAICSRLSTSQLFQQRVVHLKIALKVSLRLESCLVPERFWKIFYGATSHEKDLKIGSAAFLFTLSLPLCLCILKLLVIFASRLPSRSAQILRAEGPKKRGFDLQLAMKMLPSSPIRFSVYPVYGFANRTMTTRRRIFPSAPLSLFWARRPFPWLAIIFGLR